MISTPRQHLLLLATSTALMASCSDLPKLEYETEHLELGADFPLCRGNLDHYEHVVTTLETELDTSLDHKVEVYLWDLREGENPGWCEHEGFAGCFLDGKIYSEVHSVEHELVHAVIDSFGLPSRFWSEGAAEALQVDRTRFGTRDPSVDVDAEWGVGSISYNTAGHFSRWLIETYGIELYRQLLRSPEAGSEAFETVYEVPLEVAQSEYFEQAPHSYGAYISCEDPPLTPVDDQHWSESIEIDCAEGSTYGSVDGLYSRRLLTITERGNYSLSTSATQMSILRCPDGDYAEPPSLDEPEQYGDVPEYTEVWLDSYLRVLDGSGEVTTLDLTPGRYQIGLGNESFEPSAATLEVLASTPP